MKKNLYFTLLLLAFSILPLWAQNTTLKFNPETYSVGKIQQGDVRHIVLKGINQSSKTIDLESVMSQNIGSSNFKYPSSIKPKEKFIIEFDLNTTSIEGLFEHNMVLVTKTGSFFTTVIKGDVFSPYFFSEKMFDAGYYSQGESREWTFYVWSTDKKNLPILDLDSIAKKDFSATYQSVKINVDKLDNIKEGGTVPAVKVTLRTKGIPRKVKQTKSLRHFVGFQSKKYPNYKPEILIVGYWK